MDTRRRRRELEKEARRSEILDSAERLFVEKGFDATVMDDLSAASGFTKRTLYQYFPSKTDLFFSIAVRRVEIEKAQALASHAERCRGLDAMAKLEEISRAVLEIGMTRPQTAVILTEALRQRNWRDQEGALLTFRGLVMREYQALLGIVREGQRDGSIRRELDAPKTAFALVFVFSGYLHLIVERWSPKSGFAPMDAEAIGYGGALVLDGMRAPTRRPST